MNRIEFMNRLKQLLSDIPENERSEALQYYNDYLDDAGVENEQEVLEALGTPEKLAASIREGLSEGGCEGEFSEKGYEKKLQEDPDADQIAVRKKPQQKDFYRRYRGGESAAAKKSSGADQKERSGKRMSMGAVLMIAICCLCAAPVFLPLAFALLIVILVLIVAAAVVVLALFFSGIICIVAGLFALVAAAVKLFTVPAGAVVAVGISLMTIGAGVLMVWTMGWIFLRLFPKAFRGFVNMCSRLILRKGGRQA